MTEARRKENTDTNRAHGHSAQAEPGVCTVLHCTDESGALPWPTADAEGGWPITWAVCAYHYWQLDDGNAYVKVNQDEPAGHRWLLMDEDLEAVLERTRLLPQEHRVAIRPTLCIEV